MKLFFSLFAAFTLLSLSNYGQGTAQKNIPFIVKGESYWRGVFTLSNGQEVPFNFLVKSVPGTSKIYFLNAGEEFEGGKITQAGDSLFVSFDQFDNEFALSYENNKLTGTLRRQDKKGNPISLSAVPNNKTRFPETANQPEGDMSGTYDVRFELPGGREEKAVGLFTQDGKKLKATFLKVTGDSRYLDGIVDGNQFYLSSFIGSSPVYYRGSFTKDNKISGEIVGQRSNQKFTATPDANAALPDAYSLTYIKEGYNDFNFSFPDLQGKTVSLKDEKYKNKVVVVTIGGTWCPNCIDETAFLSPWYVKNKNRGVEVISLQYERQSDPAYVTKAITAFKNRFNVQYEQLFAGIADKQQVAESLPALNTFLSFPTTIFVGKNGKVDKIHTGFTGPATGKYYDEFKKEFEEEIAKLLAKK
ncbi:MAG: TlpA family protein disulfide reductase [Williamsia sp.]|nr:TlpA family protein disulfide reductase [Williamsia sp.]